MSKGKPDYVPALAFDALTFLYDPIVRVTTREWLFKRLLVEQAAIEAGHRMLDLGCGTATLTLEIKRLQPEAEVVGLDGDVRVLEIARRKAAAAGIDVVLDFGLSSELPYPDASFDRVLSSLLFHHLTRSQKSASLREVSRVLKPDGELHVADWGRARSVVARMLFVPIQLLDGFETTLDNVRGMLPDLMAEAGFTAIDETRTVATMFGTLSLYVARKAHPTGAESRPR